MITLSKIAKIANVSVSTASKAFSGSDEVNKETRELIFRIARQHGCFKKFYNAKYPKLVLAIIAPEFDSATYTRYLSSIQKSLGEENCELCVSTTNFSAIQENTLVEYYYKHSNVDGIILIDPQSPVTENYEVPIVLINPKYADENICSCVSHTLKPALQESIDYLISKNVLSIGFIGETLTEKKLILFKQVLADKNIPLSDRHISITADRFETGGYSAMNHLFESGDLPRAIICAYDYMAIGAIKCIIDHGLRVPEDIAVLGLDDIPQSKFLNPPLASVSIPTDMLCRIATETLLKQLNGETTAHHQWTTSAFHLRRSFEII